MFNMDPTTSKMLTPCCIADPQLNFKNSISIATPYLAYSFEETRGAMMKTGILVCALLAAVTAASGTEPNPPTWPQSVTVFSPKNSSADIEAKVNAAYATNGGHVPANHGQFSSERFAFLFKPGECACSGLRTLTRNCILLTNATTHR